MTTTTDTGRDTNVEAWLDSLRVEWRFEPALPVERIDEKASLGNQARMEALDEDVVARYAADLERGDTFPGVLARARSKGARLVLVGGNHRLAGHQRAGRTTIAAYVLTDVADAMATRMALEDNRRHGLPPSEPERIRQAIHLIDTGWTQRDAAACVGVPEPKVSVARSRIKAQRRAADNGVRRFDELTYPQQYILGTLRSDPVFKAATALVLDAAFNDTRTRNLVKELAAARSDKDAVALVEARAAEAAEHIGATAGGRVKNLTARSKLMGGLSQVRSLDVDEIVAACVDRDQAQRTAESIEDVIDRLTKVAKKLRSRR